MLCQLAKQGLVITVWFCFSGQTDPWGRGRASNIGLTSDPGTVDVVFVLHNILHCHETASVKSKSMKQRALQALVVVEYGLCFSVFFCWGVTIMSDVAKV